MSWIDINERLPEDGLSVMVLFEDGKAKINVKYYSELGFWSVWDSAEKIKRTAEKTGRSVKTRKVSGGEVTHWQPIPPPPPPKPDKNTATAVVRGKHEHHINCPQCEADLYFCCCGCGCANGEPEFPFCPYCCQRLDWRK